MTELEKEYVLIRQKRDEVPEGTLSCPDRNLAVFHHYRHYEGLRLLPSVCDSKLIQQTLNNLWNKQISFHTQPQVVYVPYLHHVSEDTCIMIAIRVEYIQKINIYVDIIQIHSLCFLLL